MQTEKSVQSGQCFSEQRKRLAKTTACFTVCLRLCVFVFVCEQKVRVVQ